MQESSQQLMVRLQYFTWSFHSIVTCVYAKCDAQDRQLLWTELIDLSSQFPNSPWLVGGDFNIILHPNEKSGGRDWDRSGALDFHACLLVAGLSDLGFSVSSYTWWNKLVGSATIHQRIDCMVCNFDWLASFNATTVQHLSRTYLDHSHLLFSISSSSPTKPVAFRFLNAWVSHPSFLEVVRAAWNDPVQGRPMQAFAGRMCNVKNKLKSWNKNEFGNIFTLLKEAEDTVLEKELLFEIYSSGENRAALFKLRLSIVFIWPARKLIGIRNLESNGLRMGLEIPSCFMLR